VRRIRDRSACRRTIGRARDGPAIVPAVMQASTAAAQSFFERRLSLIMRALGSPKMPRTVPSGRKPGNAYASQSRRFRFAGTAIRNFQILSTPPHAQNPAMMRLYEVLTPEITHTTFQKTHFLNWR
jgi:hypothetical protein